MSPSNKRIIILGNTNHNIINGNLQSIGGAETQLQKLAEALSKYGFRVCFIIPGTERSIIQSGGLEIQTISNNLARPIGFFNLLSILHKIKPDIIITRAANPLLLHLAVLKLIVRAKLIYFSAHDWELSPRENRLDSWRWQMFRLALQFCTKIFVQNEVQKIGFKGLLLSRRSRVSSVKNLPLLNAVDNLTEPGELFTWIGTNRPHKRPEWIIEIARQLPEKQFKLILYCWEDENIEAEFRRKIEGINNISFSPGIKRGQLAKAYEQSIAIFITSEGEGFPNVAIEAWSQGRAVISTHSNILKDLSKDDGVILVHDTEDIVRVIQDNSADDFSKIGKNGFNYFITNYSTEDIIEHIQSNF